MFFIINLYIDYQGLSLDQIEQLLKSNIKIVPNDLKRRFTIQPFYDPGITENFQHH